MNTKLTLLGLFVLGSALSGCGPNLVSDDAPANERGGSFSFGQSADSTYSCPSSENVTPADDRVMDGTQYYTACTTRASPTSTKIKVVGYSSTSRMICAFPVQYLNTSQFIYKLDNYGQPMYKCYDGWANSANTAELDFPYTNYNGLVIVDQGSRPSMSGCLISGSGCPTHSIGQFR